jgi:dienelactone hydrolase
VQAALTFIGAQLEADVARLGIYGTSYGGATVVFVAAVDPRVQCVVSIPDDNSLPGTACKLLSRFRQRSAFMPPC